MLGVLAALHGVRRTAGFLAAAAAVALTASAGLRVLGIGLSGFRSLQQPVDLNSLLLAIGGTGQDLLPVPLLLAIGAAVAFAVSRHGRRTAPAIVAG
ncbi:hypothetical protein [uncultured Amnibacterium sp.]|uniref:hypothetical protein n=1 Tax=uncultured Amnibacterium sp. TaxID=1631851 RepID=UPI0035CB67F9